MSPSTSTKKETPNRGSELVTVAARLFRERGYDATSMQGIAAEMGILKGSLYHYVATKEDLLWMVVEPPLTELVNDVTVIFDDASATVADRIRSAMRLHCESYERHYPHMFVITRENGETLSRARRKKFDALRDRYYQLWCALIREGVESGELRDDLDVPIVVEGVFGMVNWMFRWFKPDQRLNAAEIAEQFATIAVSGIASRGRSRGRG